jgi:hypothetical protein
MILQAQSEPNATLLESSHKRYLLYVVTSVLYGLKPSRRSRSVQTRYGFEEILGFCVVLKE